MFVVEDEPKAREFIEAADDAVTGAVVGIFPDDRLVAMLAIEANGEWLVRRSYISRGSMATLYDKQSDGSLSPGSEEVAELLAAA